MKFQKKKMLQAAADYDFSVQSHSHKLRFIEIYKIMLATAKE